jgi:hypothetical protein
MDLRKLKTLIDLVQNSGISELEISEGEEKIRIAKHLTARRRPPWSACPWRRTRCRRGVDPRLRRPSLHPSRLRVTS